MTQHSDGNMRRNYSVRKGPTHKERYRRILRNQSRFKVLSQREAVAEDYVRKRKAELRRRESLDYALWWERQLNKADRLHYQRYVCWWKAAIRQIEKMARPVAESKPAAQVFPNKRRQKLKVDRHKPMREERTYQVSRPVPRKDVLAQLAELAGFVPLPQEYAVAGQKVVSFSAYAMSKKDTYGRKIKGPALTEPKGLAGADLITWENAVSRRKPAPTPKLVGAGSVPFFQIGKPQHQLRHHKARAA